MKKNINLHSSLVYGAIIKIFIIATILFLFLTRCSEEEEDHSQKIKKTNQQLKTKKEFNDTLKPKALPCYQTNTCAERPLIKTPDEPSEPVKKPN